MKILFYDTKSYDKESFTKQAANYPDIEIDFLKMDLGPHSCVTAKGYDAVCGFVNSQRVRKNFKNSERGRGQTGSDALCRL